MVKLPFNLIEVNLELMVLRVAPTFLIRLSQLLDPFEDYMSFFVKVMLSLLH